MSHIKQQPAFLIEMYMGLRIGEVLALKKSNVDLMRNLIYAKNTKIIHKFTQKYKKT